MTEGRSERQWWLAVLAQTPARTLEAVWAGLDDRPQYTLLRKPEIGLVMVRGRMGGTGGRFNLGETTVTRCAVRLSCGTIGHGYVQGRDKRKAERVAALDAVLQVGRAEGVIEPLAHALEARRATVRAKSAATKVDFFTLVRGAP